MIGFDFYVFCKCIHCLYSILSLLSVFNNIIPFKMYFYIEVIFSNLVAISYWENYCINVAWHILNIYNIYSILYVRYAICVMIKPRFDDNLLNIFLSKSWYRNVHYAPFVFLFLSLSLPPSLSLSLSINEYFFNCVRIPNL